MITKSFLCTTLLLLCLSGCQAKGEMKTKHDEEKQISWLFVLHSDKGTYKNHQLTLKDVADSVTMFSDRPNRLVRRMPTERFVNLWNKKETFKEDRPNASFVFFHEKSDKYKEIVVELENPQYDPSMKTLTFSVNILQQEDEDALEPDFTGVSVLFEPLLFIDTYYPDPCMAPAGDCTY